MKTVVIIGGGFSGILTAVHLLSGNDDIRVKIINEKYPLGLGPAYSATSRELILNIAAGNMSAFPEQPEHFTEWLKQNKKVPEGSQPASQFVPRSFYGEYLREIILPMKSDKRFQEIQQRATGISTENGKYLINLSDNTKLNADYAVLAPGNFLPAHPKIKSTSFLTSKNYFQDPWNTSFLHHLDLRENILLIGSGLTMIDCFLQLCSVGHTGIIFAVSPKGFTPASHKKSGAYHDISEQIKGKRLVEIFKIIRQHCKKAEEQGSSWQSVIDSIKPFVQQIWTGLTEKDKQQFISHVRHIWGVARHRLPENPYSALSRQINKGQLKIIAGRIKNIEEKDDGAETEVLLRRTGATATFTSSIVINCTGPQINYEMIDDPLIKDLLEKGLICAHPLKMGIKATLEGQALCCENEIPGLYAIGSILRGELWETTAVPELRKQAIAISNQIKSFKSPSE